MRVVAGVVVIVVAGVLVGVLAAADVAQGDVVGDGERRRAVGGRAVDDPGHALLEPGAVDHEQIGVLHRLGLAGRGRELVRVGPDRHDHVDVRLVADELPCDIAQDARRDDHVRPVRRRVGPGVAAAPRSDDAEQRQRAATENRSHAS